MLIVNEDGFKRFLVDFQGALNTNIRVQALNNTSQALTEPRFKVSKEGHNPDHTLETAVLQSMATENQKGVQVNIQNNVWADARKIAGK